MAPAIPERATASVRFRTRRSDSAICASRSLLSVVRGDSVSLASKRSMIRSTVAGSERTSVTAVRTAAVIFRSLMVRSFERKPSPRHVLTVA